MSKTWNPSLAFARCVFRRAAVSTLCAVVFAGAPASATSHAPVAKKMPTRAAAKFSDLAGSVVDSNGVPVSKATVYIYTAGPRVGTSPLCPSCYVDCGKQQATDAKGRFRIASLASSLIFRILVVRDGYEPTFVSNVDPVQGGLKVVLKPVAPSSGDPQRLLLGRVVDPDGQPVVGATVEPCALKTGNWMECGTIQALDAIAITNERGEFRFRCPDGGSVVYALVKARGLAPKVAPEMKAGPGNLTTVALSVGTTIIGTVKSAMGRKMPGVTVQVVPVDRNTISFVGWFEIATDKDGAFNLPNIPFGQDYVICTRMDSLADANLGAPCQSFTTGKSTETVDMKTLVLRPAAVISGRVTLPDGKAVPAGTQLMLGRENTWDNQRAVVAADGRFSFKAVPQEQDITLSIQVPGYQVAATTEGYDMSYGYPLVRLKLPVAESTHVQDISLVHADK